MKTMPKYKLSCGCTFEQESESIKDYDGLPPISIDYYNLPMDCPRTWDLIGSGRTRGVFQLESNLGRSYASKLQPDNIDHLAALISILRPGTMNALLDGKSMTNHYVDRKHNREAVTYIDNKLEQYLDTTFGILVYQEQSIAIAKGLAGFTPEQANALRKAIGKKKADELAKLREVFIQGCIEKSGFNKDIAIELFDNIESSNRYSFNACISFDTLITKQSVGNKDIDYTVEHMFNIKNNIEYAKKHNQLNLYKKYKMQGHYGRGLSMSEDGRIRPNIIKDIRFAGKRQTFKIILNNGNFIKVTDNHKFPTPDGIKLTSELVVGNKLYTCGKYEKNNTRYKFSNISSKELRESGKTYEGNGFQLKENNPSYTNGSYTDFINNGKLLPKTCQICNQEHRRLEIHHKNGDRTNSKLENLIRLCPSCHKKEEYKVGRTKRGEKGYPTILSEIISIEKDEIVNTYDVEMDAPNHTFIANGDILTCNSHAYTYSFITYATAYAKAHFPIHFFCAALKQIKDMDELKDLMSEVALFDLEVLGPSIANPLSRFNITDGRIQYGWSEIRKSGHKDVVDFVNYIVEMEKKLGKEAKEFTWYEFLILIASEMRSDAMVNLISCGILDNTGISRKEQLHEFNIFQELSGGDKKWILENYKVADHLAGIVQALIDSGKVQKKRESKIKGLHSTLQNPGKSLSDNVDFVCNTENELMGYACSMSRTANKEKFANIKIYDFLLGKGSKDLAFVVEVKSVEERIIKTGKNAGKKMANIKLADRSGEMECSIFSADWIKRKTSVVRDNVLLIRGSRHQDMSLKIEDISVI